MALTFAAAGEAAQREPNGAPTQMYHPGNTAVVASGASSANVALPLDGNGNAYQAFLITATAAAWVAFCTTGADAVVAATAPAILITGYGQVFAVPPIGAGTGGPTNAKFLAAIQAASAGTVCIVGLY
jgi:hypothetical protein